MISTIFYVYGGNNFMTDVQFNNNYDVFHSFLVKNADYEGYFELPVIKRQAPLFPKHWCRFQRQWQEHGMILTAGLCFMSMM